MKLNKPHVFLYRETLNSNNLILVVLVPSNYEKSKQVISNRNDSTFIIELKGSISGMVRYCKYEFEVNREPYRKIKIITKSSQGEGFTILNTEFPSVPEEPWRKQYIAGFHLAKDITQDPVLYTVHGLVSDFKNDFTISDGVNSGDGRNYSADLNGNVSVGDFASCKKSFSANEIGQTIYNEITISVPALTPEGKVILYHDDADDKMLPFE